MKASGEPGGRRRTEVAAEVATEVAVVLVALVLSAWAHRATLVNAFVVNNDVRQYTYTFDRDHDPALFRDDPLTDYSRAYSPWAYRALYRSLAPLIPPRQLARVLPIALFALSAWLAFRIGRRMGGAWQGALTAAWLAACPIVLHKMAGGHPRAFALPLLLLFLDQLGARRALGMGLALFLLAAFYPMAFLAAVLTLGLCAVRWWPRPWRWALPPRLLARAAAGILLGGGLLLLQQRAMEERYGSIVSRAEMEGRAEYGPRGPYPVLPTEPLPHALAREVRLSNALLWPDGLLPGRLEAREREGVAWLSLGALVLVLLWGWRRGLPKFVPALLLASAALYGLADLLLLRLFLPERYLQYPVRVAAAVLGAWMLARALERVSPRARWVMLVLVLSLFTWKLPSLDGVGLTDFSAHRALAKHLRTLPVEATIAAHPLLADEIPLFTSRKVWVDSVHAHTFFPRYWQTVADRTRRLLAAYYAEDRAEVCAFFAQSGTSVLVVDAAHFERRALKRRRLYFEPFHSELKAALAGRERLALAKLSRRETVFRDGGLAVVSPASLGCSSGSR